MKQAVEILAGKHTVRAGRDNSPTSIGKGERVEIEAETEEELARKLKAICAGGHARVVGADTADSEGSTSLADVAGKRADVLRAAGIDSVEALAGAEAGALAQLEGIGEATASKLLEAAQEAATSPTGG